MSTPRILIAVVNAGNFARTMLGLAQERERMTIINYQIGAPTGADLIADVSAHVLRNNEVAGTYHLAPSGETSWHGYASHVIETAKRLQPKRAWTVQAIDPIPTTAFPTPAKRPLNSRLDTSRLQMTFGLHLPPWQQCVDRLLVEIL